MVITTGMFNKKVSFIRYGVKVNSFGGRGGKTEEELFTCYAYLSNLRNSEFWESRHGSDKSKLRIRIRFTPKALKLDTKDCFVKIDNKTWNILSIENVLNRNKEFLMYLEYRDE